jgi:hypothetical protein
MGAPTLALADVHRVTTMVGGREIEVFLFDHHRTAFTLWSLAAQRLKGPLTLLTLDRHMDFGVPEVASPDYTSSIEELDAFARHRLATSNDNHIVAAMRAGAIGDAAVIARSHQPPELERFRPFVDERGRKHRCEFAPTVSRAGAAIQRLVNESTQLVLDIDLDCFTTMSDAHVEEVLAWDAALIDEFLRPPGSEAFWADVLSRVEVITIAREPYHCGGFSKGAKLWIDFATVFFERVLGVPAP